MKEISEFFNNLKIKHFEAKMKKLKPQLLLSWYDTQEENIRKEYEEEMEKLHDEIYELKQDLAESKRNASLWQGKYEGVIETQDKVREQLITKVESNAEGKGKLKEQVKQLKDENKEVNDKN